MVNPELFTTLWTANFGRPDAETVSAYCSALSEATDEEFSAAVSALGEEFATQRDSGRMASKPTVPQIMRLVRQARKDGNPFRAGDNGGCGVCKGTGLVSVLTAVVGSKRTGVVTPKQLRPCDYLELVATACHCHNGMRVAGEEWDQRTALDAVRNRMSADVSLWQVHKLERMCRKQYPTERKERSEGVGTGKESLEELVTRLDAQYRENVGKEFKVGTLGGVVHRYGMDDIPR